MVEGASPLISIIVPTFNYGRFIGQTLNNLQSQTYVNWECVVVDDGSTDDTESSVREFRRHDERIRYIYKENGGVSSARNIGIAEARGRYIQFLDSDDFLERRKLEIQSRYLDHNQHVEIIYGNVRGFGADTENESDSDISAYELEWFPRFSGYGKDAIKALLRVPFPLHAPLLRKETISKVGNFDETFSGCADWNFWMRCAVAGLRFEYLPWPETAALYRQHPNSMCKDKELMNFDRRRMRKAIERMILDDEILSLNHQYAVAYEGYLGVDYIKEGNRLKAMSQFLKASMESGRLKEKLKWAYCALLACLAPSADFEKTIVSPVSQSAIGVLRRYARRES